jgi:hypothetical protein
MRRLTLALVCLIATTSSGWAQSAAPDIRGSWNGKGKSVFYGSNPHHPGNDTATSPARVVDYDFTFVVDGQQGPLAWGHSFSTVAATNEPFAWSFGADNKSMIGADTDGYYRITMLSADQMELCYAHNSLGPTKSIVATCGKFDRIKK